MKNRFQSSISEFLDDTKGGITAFTIIVFVIMIISVGMAVDFMRHEALRAELQDAVDRGVLAATAFDQSVAAEETVRGYIKSTRFVPNGYTLKVTDKSDKNDDGSVKDVRRIEAVASYQFNTFFLKLAGIPTLKVEARGEALEGVGQVEITMVFDISGSMAGTAKNATQSRIEILRASAETFVNKIFDQDASGAATISLIPFAGGVNAGQVAFDHFVDTQVHSYSRCLQFPENDYLTSLTSIPGSLSQIQHFESNRSSNTPDDLLGWGGCPSNAQEIEYFSADRDALIARVRGLKGHDYTATHDGMRWANMISDPDFNVITQKLVTSGDVAVAQESLPGALKTGSNRKYIILMSDGKTTRTQVVEPQHYQDADDHAFFDTNRARNSVLSQPLDSDQTRQRLANACKTAKDNGIVVFTIGFDIKDGSDAYNDLSDCATEGKFFPVEGNKLVDAFNNISVTIQKLRLTS